jgi:hypothetical protein
MSYGKMVTLPAGDMVWVSHVPSLPGPEIGRQFLDASGTKGLAASALGLALGSQAMPPLHRGCLVPQTDLGRPSSPCMGAAQRMDQDHPWWRVGIKKSKVALRLQGSAQPYKPRLVVEKGTPHGRPLQKIRSWILLID